MKEFKASILNVSDDALRYIFVFLEFGELQQQRLVCKEFNRVIHNELTYGLLISTNQDERLDRMKRMTLTVRLNKAFIRSSSYFFI